jgi:predicted DNA-binding transcriptional regulator AlpA
LPNQELDRSMKNATYRELDPNEIFRLDEGTRLFGLKPSQIAEKIKSGELPKPLKLTESGRAKGWTGEQINQHYRKLFEQQQGEG